MAETLLAYAAQVGDLKRQKVVEIFSGESPILARLNFIDLEDKFSYQYSRETALPGVSVRAIGEDWSTQAEGVVAPVTEGTSIMGGPVLTDRQFLKNPSRKAGRVAAKMRAAACYFTKLFFDGDQGSNPKEFDGLNRRIGSGSQSIKAGTNGDYLDLDQLQKLIDSVVGEDAGKVLLMGKPMRRTLAATIRAQGATVVAMTEWSGPLNPKSFSGVEIVPIEKDNSGDEILGFDETCGSYTTAGSIYCAAFGSSADEDRLQGLAAMAAGGVFEVEEQGVRGSQDQTVVEGRVGIAAFHGESIARYYGIKEGVAAA